MRLCSGLLSSNNFRYLHKKEFTSLLQFPNSIWHKFDEETKQRVYFIRELEKERIINIKEKNHSISDEIEILLKNEVLEVLKISQHIQDEQVANKATNKHKLLLNN